MTELSAHGTAPPRTRALDDDVHARLLELLAAQSRRVPVAVFCLLVAVAAMAAQTGFPRWIIALWFTAATAILLLRRWWLGMLPLRTDLPFRNRMRIALALAVVNGVTHGLSVMVFPFLGDTERAFFSVLLLGLSTGAVGTTAGHRGVYLGYAVPALLPLPLVWAFNGFRMHSWTDLSLAVLIALYFWLLVGLARNAWTTFTESVQIRFQERALNAQLQDALARANDASQAKTRFLAAASHDLRQPLHTIGLLVAALSVRPADGRDRDIVDLLSQVTQALSQQLDELLDISKLDAGIVRPDRRPVALDELLRQHHAEMRGAIEAKGLQAILRLENGVHCYTDPGLLLRVLRNLTENAVKFTATGYVAIDVDARLGEARISVSDSGCGIAAQDRDKVFEEFYQVGNSERDRTQGLGLGLSIVRRLTDLLGIRLSMTSALEQGTRFELSMPLSHASGEALAPARAAAGATVLGTHVLVLDDERSVRRGMRLLLEELGCDCTEAGTTEEALEAVALSRPDIVLADMRLRGAQTGIDAVRAIRALCGPVPALLVSGDTAPDRLREAAGAGIRLLHKPVPMPLLRDAIAQAARPQEQRGEGPHAHATSGDAGL